MRARSLLPVLAAAVVLGAGSPALADEVVERPADGVFAVEGHGWGHGRGMSQWGAQGAAGLGIPAEQIVSTYYAGTARTVLAPAPIRVLLQGDEGTDLQVSPAPGLVVTDVSTGIATPLPDGPVRFRVLADSTGLHAQSFDGTAWSPVLIGGGSAHGGPLRFSGPALQQVHLPDGSRRDYRGVVQAVRTGTTTMATVVVLDLDDYLLGVVPREAPSSWKPAALQAQAIAARSYSANKRERVAGKGYYDICDTTQCQVFGGTRVHTAKGTTELEVASTTDAVRATAGVVRTYEGAQRLHRVLQQQRRLVDPGRLPVPAGQARRLGRRRRQPGARLDGQAARRRPRAPLPGGRDAEAGARRRARRQRRLGRPRAHGRPGGRHEHRRADERHDHGRRRLRRADLAVGRRRPALVLVATGRDDGDEHPTAAAAAHGTVQGLGAGSGRPLSSSTAAARSGAVPTPSTSSSGGVATDGTSTPRAPAA